jgi:hypothetical protein
MAVLRLEGVRKLKKKKKKERKLSDPILNRTCDILACSIESQQFTLLLASFYTWNFVAISIEQLMKT